jgi:hypothetical protein
MLIRISLIVAIIAGLAVGGLNFIKVKEKIVTLQTNLAEQTARADKAESDLASTRTELKNTSDKLKQTETTLAATTEEKEKFQAEADRQTKRADRLDADLAKTRQERDTARDELASYTGTGYTPQQILAFGKDIKNLQATLAGTESENKVLGQKIKRLQNELDRYVSPEKPIVLPAGLRGKILVADPKWNFVVLNVGEEQGLLPYGELLVNRNGKLVAKIVVQSVQKDRSIANVMPGWQLGDLLEGDQVIPAHPAS